MTDERAELEAERDFLLRSLRDLRNEREAGEIEEADFAALNDSYTARAGRVLRRLQALDQAAAGSTGAADAPTEPAEPAAEAGAVQEVAGLAPDAVAADAARPPLRRRLAGRRGLVVAVGLVLLGVGAGLLVYGSTGSRQVGQTVSGSVPLSPAQELSAAQQAMAGGNDITALELFQAVLRVEPNQPEALAYSGWLLREAGDEQADTKLVSQGILAEEAAVQADPQYPDARYFLGVMLLDEAHDPAGAVTEFQAYLALHPPARDVKAVEPVLARAEAEAAAQPSSPSTSSRPAVP
ncbi:MAG TPA: hypothetical protein VMU63_01755 [Acidimicrobiales bacterium]|nr:hypothetical protein [Acidimicrobiales bacterium]